MVFSNNLLMGAAGQSTGYEIDQSIRFNQADSARLTRTPSSAGNRKTFTFSCWLKRGNISTLAARFFTGYQDVNNQFEVYFNTSDNLVVAQKMGGTWYEKTTSQVFRDPSAWYNFVWYWDTTDSTADDRTRGYINGERLTFASGANPSLNADGMVNATIQHEIAGEQAGSTYYYDGYIAEIHLIDGTALDPSSFGKTNADGVWVPIEYTGGSYGTNGFYITGATSSDLGEDFSGNNNDFTSSGLTSADQMPDTPTLNASTLNPLWAGAALSDGNLVATASGNSYQRAISTFAIDDGGKYACEFQKSSGTFGLIGIMQLGNNTVTSGNSNMYGYNVGTGEVFKGNPTASILIDLGAGAANSLMRVEYDSSADTIKIFDDGVEIFPAATGVSNTVGLTGQNSLHFGCAPYGSGTKITATFQGLSGTPTADFLELTSANLATPSITDGSKYFQPTVYTGNGTAIGSGGLEVNQSGNSTFQPDFAWIKNRTTSGNEHDLYDAVRGVTKAIFSSASSAEATVSEGLTAFDADGFTVGNRGEVNTSGNSMVAWQWKANGTGSSNEDGTINTTATSVNTTAGFSISTYTGTGANATVGHGLGIAPSFVAIKSRNDTHDWYVRTPALSGTEFLLLNTTAAKGTASPEVWNSTTPTSTVVNIGTSIGVNRNTYNYVMYCFAEIPGYSSIGIYEANASTDGPFVYTGFKPSFVLIKNIDAAEDWWIQDDAREPFNGGNMARLAPNSSAAEADNVPWFDFLSNGLKVRYNAGGINASGTHIYMAFAENPFGGDGVAPATAI